MRIGLTTTSFRTDQGGERFVVNLAKGLLQADQEVHVIGRLEHRQTLEAFQDNLTAAQQAKFYFHRVRTLKFHRYPNIVTYAWGVERILRSLPLDVVQGFGKSLGLDIFRQPTASYKTLLQISNPRIKSRLASNFELEIERKLFYEEAKAVVVASQYSKRTLLEAYPDLKVPIHIIYNMVDVDAWQRRSDSHAGDRFRRRNVIPEDGFVFLHASTNFALKGVPEALGGLSFMKSRLPANVFEKVYLLLVGQDDYPIPPDLKENVRIFPRTIDIVPFYAAADVLLHPTRFDPFANVVLEAFASGIPVITSCFAGASELVDEGVDGSVLTDLSPEAVGSKMMEFMDASRLAQYTQNVPEKAKQFSIPAIIEQYINLYQEVAALKKTGK